MIALDAVKAAILLFFVAIIQVSLLSSVDVYGGMPNLLLVTIVAVALLRGSVFGAAGGFFGGLLLDTANLETLGLTSLVLTVGGYWIGRYGETTGRDRTHAPFVSVAVVTVLYAVGVLVLHFLLGDPVSGAADPARVARPVDRVQPHSHGAGLLDRHEAAAAARLARARGGGAPAWLAEHLPPARPTRRGAYRLTPQMALRVAVLGGVVLLVFCALFLRLWALEILSGHQYLRVAQNNQLRTIRVEAPRGVILDRNGRILVDNHAGTAVVLWPADLPHKWYLRLRELKRPQTDPARADQRHAEGDRGAQGRPADAGDRQGAGRRARRSATSRNTRTSSAASASRTRSCATIRTGRSRRSSSATSPKSRSRS